MSGMTRPKHQADSDTSAATVEGLLQRKCSCGQHTSGGTCEICKEKRQQLHRKGSGEAPDRAPPIVGDVLRTSGQQIDAANRRIFETRFGHDFASVRVHTDARAAASARAVNAHAYTVANHIVFGANHYEPGTQAGRHLLAHELAHTLQQRASRQMGSSTIAIAPGNDPAEHDAALAADQFSSGGPVNALGEHSAGGRMHRLGDLSQVPAGLPCNVATTSPTPPVRTVQFGQGASALTPVQQADVETVVSAWHAAGSSPVIRVDGYASTEGGDPLNWSLSCARANAVAAELTAPSSGNPGIPGFLVDVFAQGETDEFSPTTLPPNRVGTITSTAPLPAPVCTHPGVSRTVDLQPVFFRTGSSDSSPTGGSYNRRHAEANSIWGKLGVTFNSASAVVLDDATNKTAGSTEAEANRVAATHTAAGIEVFLVDNDMSSAGGASTLAAGAGSNVVMSDRGTSDTLLAHELGHVLGLDHPPGGGDSNTIMTPSGSNSAANPTRNTLGNFNRITFPAGSGSTCLLPDP